MQTDATTAETCLPPGTYTLNYREGMQLDAQEAWDYLAGGEGRRCFTENTKDLIRIHGGEPEVRIGAKWERIYNSKLNGKFYTIAPDEPAMQRCSECAEQRLPNPCPKCKLPEPAETDFVTAHSQAPPTPWCEGRADGLSEPADKLRASSAMCAMAAEEMTSAASYMLALAAERDRFKDCCREAREQAADHCRIADDALGQLKDANGKLETLRSVRTDLCRALGLELDATWGDVEKRCVANRERAQSAERFSEGWRKRAEAAEAWVEDAKDRLRGARERVAELEGSYATEKEFIDAKRIADLEAKLAEAEKDNAKLRRRLAGLNSSRVDRLEYRIACLRRSREVVSGQRDAAIAERDRIATETKAWRDSFRQAFQPGPDLDRETDWPQVMGVEVGQLRARIDTLEAQVHQMEGKLPTPNSKLTGVAHRDVETLSAECGRHQRRIAELCKKLQGFEQCDIDRVKAEEERDKLRAEVERLTRDWWSVCQWLALDDDHPGIVCAAIDDLQHRTITLPTDTTTPLDLAQRAVALMGGRELMCRGFRFRMRETTVEILDNDILDNDNWRHVGREWTGSLLWDDDVTLAPEPAHAPRKLSFGEAVELATKAQHMASVATLEDGPGYLIRSERKEAVVYLNDDDTWEPARLTPAMLAAEWEAAS